MIFIIILVVVYNYLIDYDSSEEAISPDVSVGKCMYYTTIHTTTFNSL